MSPVLILSYDLRGTTLQDETLIRQKLRRDALGTDDDVVMLSWAPQQKTYTYGPRLRVIAYRARSAFLKPFYDVCFIWKVRAFLRESQFKPERIIVAEYPLLWAGARARRISGAKLELHLNNLPVDLARTRNILSRAYAVLQEHLTLRIPDSFVVINETTKQYLLARGIAEAHIVVRTPDTIAQDQALIAQAVEGKVRAQYGIAQNDPILLSVGRLEPEKGFEELLSLYAAMSSRARLVIVGDGSLRTTLERQCKTLGIENRVIFAGFQDRAHIWNYYKDAAAFTLLSKSEALGLVFLEAMHMRVPVIGRPVGGIRETIGDEGERGLYWNTADGSSAFQEKVITCIERRPEVESMILRAAAYAGAMVARATMPL